MYGSTEQQAKKGTLTFGTLEHTFLYEMEIFWLNHRAKTERHFSIRKLNTDIGDEDSGPFDLTFERRQPFA
jgi:hypothetical protein